MLHVSGLGKSFGAVRALRGVTFSVGKGRITALLGENGAGKTTTLRIVLGFLRPDAGTVACGAARLGYVPDQPAFFAWLTGRDLLDLTRRSLGAGRLKWQSRVRGLCEKLLFDPALLERRPGTYSAGNAKKFACLQGLAMGPDLLVVDEPFSALDPPSVKRLRDLFLELRDGGASVLLSSHMLAEMVRIADDFVVLRRGEVVARSGFAEFLSRFRPADAVGLEEAFLGLMRGEAQMTEPSGMTAPLGTTMIPPTMT
jgi:ABC-type multidrug transport system ATPase subunit